MIYHFIIKRERERERGVGGENCENSVYVDVMLYMMLYH